ncbi:MAG: hypothetical protein ABR975_15470 [Vulcanimicrobiaceae bacterium]
MAAVVGLGKLNENTVDAAVPAPEPDPDPDPDPEPCVAGTVAPCPPAQPATNTMTANVERRRTIFSADRLTEALQKTRDKKREHAFPKRRMPTATYRRRDGEACAARRSRLAKGVSTVHFLGDREGNVEMTSAPALTGPSGVEDDA